MYNRNKINTYENQNFISIFTLSIGHYLLKTIRVPVSEKNDP